MNNCRLVGKIIFLGPWIYKCSRGLASRLEPGGGYQYTIGRNRRINRKEWN
jgi:hypothetical protein